MSWRQLRSWLSALLLALLAGTGAAASEGGAEFRWSSQGELTTLDPHVLNEGLTSTLLGQVYEGLTCRDANLKLAACLAVSWSQPRPDEWLFKLREKVQFQDGTVLTAEDVVFSLERARHATSPFLIFLSAVDQIRSPRPGWVSITTRGPNPILPEQLTEIRIVSAAWSRLHGAATAPKVNANEQGYTTFNAMGTGPYRVDLHRVGVETRFRIHDRWWGQKTRRNQIATIRYLPIVNSSTRVSALVSGAIDFVLDPPLQDLARLRGDPNLRVIDGNEVRTIYLGFDQTSSHLRYGGGANGNPFKDRRVRLAFYKAIDVPTLVKVVMRGYAKPAGLLVAPQVFGYDPLLDIRLPFDPEGARKLLADAGYAKGFELTLDCPNNRYVNDERVCLTVAQMLAKVGVMVRVNAMPRSTYFPKLQSYDTSFFLFGAGSPTLDGHYTLQALMRTRATGEDGLWNIGGYSNPQLDARTERAAVESVSARRYDLIRDAFRIHAQDIGHIPLYHQVIPWVTRKPFEVVHRADNRLDFTAIRVAHGR